MGVCVKNLADKPAHTPARRTQIDNQECGFHHLYENGNLVGRVSFDVLAAASGAVSLMEDLQEYLCEHGGAAVELLERVDAWLAKAQGGAE